MNTFLNYILLKKVSSFVTALHHVHAWPLWINSDVYVTHWYIWRYHPMLNENMHGISTTAVVNLGTVTKKCGKLIRNWLVRSALASHSLHCNSEKIYSHIIYQPLQYFFLFRSSLSFFPSIMEMAFCYKRNERSLSTLLLIIQRFEKMNHLWIKNHLLEVQASNINQ